MGQRKERKKERPSLAEQKKNENEIKYPQLDLSIFAFVFILFRSSVDTLAAATPTFYTKVGNKKKKKIRNQIQH